MATANIQDVTMTYSSALEIAKAIDDKRLDFNGMRGTLDNLVDRLNGQWEGTAQREFVTAYNKLKPKLKLISETMERYSQEIRAAVKAEQEADSTSGTGFKSLDSWFGLPVFPGSLERGKLPSYPSQRGIRKEGTQEKKTTKDTKANHAQKKSSEESKDLDKQLEERKKKDYRKDVPAPAETTNQSNKKDLIQVNTPLLAQKTPYNCAFASGSMLLNAIGINASEDDIIGITGGDNNLYEVNKALNKLGNDRFNEIYCDYNEDTFRETVAESLKKGVPVQVNVSLPTKEPFGYTSGGHYVVVTGMYVDNSGVTQVIINDPYSADYFNKGIVQGQTIEMPLSTLCSVRGHGYLIVGK